MPEFKNLNELRKELRERFEKRDPSTGVICARCGTELLEERPGTAFIGVPAQIRAECPGCYCDTSISIEQVTKM